jgi:hypothetical protein
LEILIALSGGIPVVQVIRTFGIGTIKPNLRDLQHAQTKQQITNEFGMGCLQASRKDETMRGSTGVADTAGERSFLPLPVGLGNSHQAVSPVGWTNSSRLGTENKDWFPEFHGARFLVPCRNRCDELAAERCL